jgi:hypothetical protein
MKFKEFLQLELDGLFGNVNGDLGIFQKQLKDCKPVKNKGSTVSRMSSVTKPSMPARPAGLSSYKKPMTIPSLLS